MTTGVRRPSLPATSALILALLLTFVFIACTQETGTGTATAGAGKEAASTNTNPTPTSPQAASTGTVTPTPVDPQTAGAGTATPDAGKQAASTNTTPAPVDPEDAGVLYAQCMRANGVPNFPDPGPDGRFALSHGAGGISQDDPKFRTASEKCRGLAPGGEHRGTGDPAYVEQMREFSKCMRDNGLPDFPDPEADGRLRGLGHEAQDNPTYRAAMAACTEALPGGGAHR